MNRGLSLDPCKKAAVTSKSMILSVFPDGFTVASLQIKLLATLLVVDVVCLWGEVSLPSFVPLCGCGSFE